MNKAAAGAVVAMFTVGAGAMTMLGAVLGIYAEPATVVMLGAGLFAGSSLLQGVKDAAPAGVAKEA
ncbi:MAG: hypothetical protein ABW123_09195 [Cystobacter sp.]